MYLLELTLGILMSKMNVLLVLVLSACIFESEGKAMCCKTQTGLLTINVVDVNFLF